MQGTNQIERSSAKDALLQMGAKRQAETSKHENAFRDAIKKAIDEKDEAKASVDTRKNPEGAEEGQKTENKRSGKAEGTEGKETKPEKPQQEGKAPEEKEEPLGALVSQLAHANIIVMPYGKTNREDVNKTIDIEVQGLTSEEGKSIPVQIALQAVPSNRDLTGQQAKPDMSGAAGMQKQSQTQSSAAAQQSDAQSKTENTMVKPEAAAPQSQQAQTKQPVQAQQAAEMKQAESAKEAKPEQGALVKPEIIQNPDKIYVKVGEGSQTNTQQFASDLSAKILTKMSEGKQQFDIELMPQELGKITIKLTIEGGKADILLQCMNPKTQQLVMAGAESIRHIVESQTGMQTTVNGKENPEEQQQYNDFDGRGEQNKPDEQGRHKKHWTEAEADIFVQQLRLGLTESAQI